MTTTPHSLARVRSSGWHYLFVLISVAAAAGIWVAILLPFSALRANGVPLGAFLSGGTGFGNVFLFCPPIYPAIIIGMMLGRRIVQCIPDARVALEPELGDTKTVSQLRTYAKGGLAALIVVLPLCGFGAVSTWAITPSRIDVRPIFTTTAETYDWSSVRAIRTGCTEGRGTRYHFVLVLADSTHIDLMQDDPWRFAVVYPRVQLALTGHSYLFDNDGFVRVRCATYPRRSWQNMLTEPPTVRISSN